MGWTYLQKPNRPKEYLDGLLTWESEHYRHRVLNSAFYGRFEYYAAVETTRRVSGRVVSREVWAAVFLVRYTRGGELGYKDMDETVGPVAAHCPKSILRLLTATDSLWARRWRADCWQWHRPRDAMRTAKPGDKFYLYGNLYEVTDLLKGGSLRVRARGTTYKVLPRYAAAIEWIKKEVAV